MELGQIRVPGIEHVLDAIEKVARTRPLTCPWRAYAEPDVMPIIQLYHAASNNEGALLTSLLPMDPTRMEWEGVQFYSDAVARCREDIRKKQEKAPPPPRQSTPDMKVVSRRG